MSIVAIAVLAVVAGVIVAILHKVRQDRVLQSDLQRMEAELEEMLRDNSTTELEMDLWEARNFSQIDDLDRQGQASSLIHRLRHFHVA